jgi:hypothetical protein
MSTNYYLVYNETIDNTCPCCGHGIVKKKELHLGKSSSGWTFALHVYPEQGIYTWADIMYECVYAIKDGGWIRDEYGTEVEYEMFTGIVEDRGSDKTLSEKVAFMNIPGWHSPMAYRSVEEMLQRNNAVAGPNNLLRHKIDQYCIGQGDGTYDYLVGEFS